MARRAVITILDQLVEDIIQLHSDGKQKEIDHLRFTQEMIDEVNARRHKCPPLDRQVKEFTFQGYKAIRVDCNPGVVLKWRYYLASEYEGNCCQFVVLPKNKEYMSAMHNEQELADTVPEVRNIYIFRPSRRSLCGAYCKRNEELRIVVIWT